MLAAISQEQNIMQITLYTRQLCSWCQEAKHYLQQQGIPFTEVDVGQNPPAYDEMKRLSGQHRVPTIVVDGHVLADFDVEQLKKFLAQLTG